MDDESQEGGSDQGSSDDPSPQIASQSDQEPNQSVDPGYTPMPPDYPPEPQPDPPPPPPEYQSYPDDEEDPSAEVAKEAVGFGAGTVASHLLQAPGLHTIDAPFLAERDSPVTVYYAHCAADHTGEFTSGGAWRGPDHLDDQAQAQADADSHSAQWGGAATGHGAQVQSFHTYHPSQYGPYEYAQ